MKPLWKRLPWFEIFILIALLSVNGYAAFSDAYNFPNKWFTRDDAYYYFKVAQNISEGRGSTFDGLNLTNGYHPLWMLVCVPIFALARFDLILPLRILLLVLAALRAATAILLYCLLKRNLSAAVAVLAALYWAFDLNLHWNMYQQGLESGLAVFCLILFLFVLQRFEHDPEPAPVKWRRPTALGLLAVLLTFSRLDLAFLALLFGLWFVFRGYPLRFLLPLDLLWLAGSAVGAFILRTGLPGYYLYKEAAILTLAVSVMVRVPLFYFLGLYEHPKAYSLPKLAWQVFLGAGISTLVSLALLTGLYALGLTKGSFPRSVPLIESGLLFPLILFGRLVYALFSRRKERPVASKPLRTLQVYGRCWLAEGAIYYGILGGALSIYMLWNKWTFGTASPVSGQIKRWWGSFSTRIYGGAARYPTSFFGIDPEGDLNAWAPFTNLIGQWNSHIEMRVWPLDYGLRYTILLSLILLAMGAILLLNRRRAARGVRFLALVPLLAGSFLQVLAYNATGYAAAREWYWISQPVFLVLAGGLLLDLLTQPLRRLPMVETVFVLMALYWGLTQAIFFGQLTVAQMPYGAVNAQPPYMDIAAFVEKHTEPGSLIGMTGGGNVGYFIRERTIVNMDGLINSYAYFQAHKARQGSDYLAALGMDYIFANPTFLEAMPYRGQYTGRYEILDYYGGKAIMRFLPKP
ncbi:MAG: hypothetical protein Fur0043_10250 [Anaerolineales bacterium]